MTLRGQKKKAYFGFSRSLLDHLRACKLQHIYHFEPFSSTLQWTTQLQCLDIRIAVTEGQTCSVEQNLAGTLVWVSQSGSNVFFLFFLLKVNNINIHIQYSHFLQYKYKNRIRTPITADASLFKAQKDNCLSEYYKSLVLFSS